MATLAAINKAQEDKKIKLLPLRTHSANRTNRMTIWNYEPPNSSC